MGKRPKKRREFRESVAMRAENQIFWWKRRKVAQIVSTKLRKTAQRKPVGRRSFLEAPVCGLNSLKRPVFSPALLISDEEFLR